MKNNALIILVKNPEPGKVKTRLGKTIGYQKAADIYAQLLNYTKLVASKVDADVFVFYQDTVLEDDLWNGFNKKLQTEGDLGEKLSHAFSSIFDLKYQNVIAIGSDCVSITAKILNKAFISLQTLPVVIGPADDGGYYLIGFSSFKIAFFENKSWSTSLLLEETLQTAKALNLDFKLLETLSDIDNEQDLWNHKEALMAFNPVFFDFLKQDKIQISLIIPIYNEAENLHLMLPYLYENADDRLVEILVVDAASTDKSKEVTESNGATYLKSAEKGRAAQMNFGASKAKGNILYFLHADTKIPTSYLADIEEALKQNYDAGCYRYQFDSDSTLLKLNAWFTRLNFLFCRGGDQSLFVKKEVFNALNGFRNDYIIMEEYDFLIKLFKKYSFKIIPKNALVSARKYETNSYLRVQFANFLVFNMFRLGFSQKKLATTYKQLLNYR